MSSSGEANVSLWLKTAPPSPRFPQLDRDIGVDVAVIGGGITGLTTAYLLKQDGRSVAVLERDLVGTGTTGYTSAKVTALQGLMYRFLEESFDVDTARIYAHASETGMELVAALAGDTDVRRLPSCTFTRSREDVSRIEEEVAAASRAGLAVSFETDIGLPFETFGAVVLGDQVHFHPKRYCDRLAEDVANVFERTEAVDVDDGDPCTIRTKDGRTVRAEAVVVATQLPFIFRGVFFAKASPSRSYCVAARMDDPPAGMYISSDEPIRSIRPHYSEDQTWLIVAGEGHKVGEEQDTEKHYVALEDFARDHFGVDPEVRWSAQDYMPVDGLPYIGRAAHLAKNVYVATGFQKWGLSTGSFAGLLISDLIAERENPWAEVFDATRIDAPRAVKPFVKTNLEVAKRFIGDRLRAIRPRSIDDLRPGEGGLVDNGMRTVAAYRDDSGKLHQVSATCTHMGCKVQFNAAEKSWDCPCHGSRFDVDGHVLEGPAVRPLEDVSRDRESLHEAG
jgi:glycine/D-amino acid oxidase-like deaminating enzyme/nitrite reductase/ring-hydroxylating ferredoxin subunit